MDELQLPSSRAYQLEMYQATIKGNVIVVESMDTGSGKTHVAILRIQYELDRCSAEKLIWFLAPTVPLCEQQHETLCAHIPQVQIRLLLGSDNVERWTSPAIWTAVLRNVRIVVSTHKILADALSFGFVKMDRLALIVFDEAHHCHGDHPANEIMRDYYHRQLQQQGVAAMPHILGLTASPTMRSKITDKKEIETNLNAICVTPRIHRSDLRSYVHRPRFMLLDCLPALNSGRSILGSLLSSIYEDAKATIWNNKIMQSQLQILKLFVRKVDHIYDQVGPWASDYYIATSIRVLRDAEVLNSSTSMLNSNNGSNAFLLQILEPILDVASKSGAGSANSKAEMAISPKVRALIDFLTDDKNTHLYGIIFVTQRATVACLHALLSHHRLTRRLLRTSTFVGSSASSLGRSGTSVLGNWLDHKSQVNTLAEFKRQERNIIVATSVLEEGIDIEACNLVVCFDDPPNLKSFVQRRGRARRRESVFVLFKEMGKKAKKSAARWESLEKEMDETYLQDESARQTALATEKIRESTDETFEIKSTKAILTHQNVLPRLFHFCNTLLTSLPHVSAKSLFTFEQLPLSELITATVTLPNCVHPSVRVATSARAWVTEKMAKRDAAFRAYVQLYKAGLLNENLLPLVRDLEDDETTNGLDSGMKRDFSAAIEMREALVTVQKMADPWASVAAAWDSVIEEDKIMTLRINRVFVSRPGLGNLEFSVAVPSLLPVVTSFPLYWNETSTYNVEVGAESANTWINKTGLRLLRTITRIILQSRQLQELSSENDDILYLIIPPACTSTEDLRQWLVTNSGSISLHQWLLQPECERSRGIVDSPMLHGHLYMFKEVLEDGENVSIEHISSRKNFLKSYTSKNSVSMPPSELSARAKTRNLPLDNCRIRKMAVDDLIIARLFPSIFHVIARYLLASDLRSQLLSSVFPCVQTLSSRQVTTISSLEHIIAATSTPSSDETKNYQQLEFIGDSLLKYLVSAHLYAKYPRWPEGYLSKKRDSSVANSRLARAARETGIDAFIWSESFAGRLGRFNISDHQSDVTSTGDDANENLEDGEGPTNGNGSGTQSSHTGTGAYRRQKTNNGNRQRVISSKVLADVVEAIIGASFLSGGMESTIRCVEFFLPELKPLSLPTTLSAQHVSLVDLMSAAKVDAGKSSTYASNSSAEGSPSRITNQSTSDLPLHFTNLERLINYTFKLDKSLLLQAVTHPSFQFDKITPSYQRLEFLGDAVLDMIYLTDMLKHTSTSNTQLPERSMTLMKQALVNKGFLGWCALNTGITQTTSNFEFRGGDGKDGHIYHWNGSEKAVEDGSFKETKLERVFHLADFIRHAMPGVLSTCRDRYKALSPQIISALENGRVYPWSLLTQLLPDKALSDIVESIIGAVFIDSGGSIEQCTLVAESLGIIRYARRVIDAELQGRGFNLVHPKNRLGELVGISFDNQGINYELEYSQVKGTTTVTCAVIVDGKEVGFIRDGVSADDAKTRAAEIAIDNLGGHKN